jgi:cytoskeletal protein CcmA (bactofilin family)
MALWKENTAPARPTPVPLPEAKEPTPYAATPKPAEVVHHTPPVAAPTHLPRAEASVPRKESLIAGDITIEGKIEGGGSVRIAGHFKGDVNVQGDLTLETGAKLTGSVRADNVTIAGELEGNIEEATRVELTQSAVVIGDVKGGTLTVVAGARMRGHAEFGWGDEKNPKAGKSSNGSGHTNS